MQPFDQPFYYDEIKENVLLVYRSEYNYKNIFHTHNGYEIYIFLSGNINMLIEHSCVHLERGHIAIINPTEYHLAVSLDDSLYERITLNISPEMMNSLSTSITDFTHFLNTRQRGTNNIQFLDEKTLNELLRLLEKLNESLNTSNFGNDVLSKAYLSEILCLICNNYITSDIISANIMPKIISDTIQFVEENISEYFTMTDLEKALNFNSRYISHLFKQNTGLSLKQYILDKKITYAQKLLSQGCSVTEACYQSGFRDYSNFIRTFKKYAGKSPGSFKLKK